MGSIGGQSSGVQGSGALRILYSLVKDSVPVLAADGFTQSNPSVVTASANVSTTLPVNVKKGVLGGSVAFTRWDQGANTVGGPLAFNDSAATRTVGGVIKQPACRPLGLFINDSLGNAYENTPGVASGKGPFLRGGSVGVKVYETQHQITGSANLSYAAGDRLYASVNGLLTNVLEDSFEFAAMTSAGASPSASDVTVMGVVLAPPDATSAELFLTLSFV